MKRFVTSVLVAITVSAVFASVTYGQRPVKKLRKISALPLVNEFRAQNGAAPLRKSSELEQVAFRYAQLMAQKDQMGHSLDGKTAGHRISMTGYRNSRWGENVAINSVGLRDGYKDVIDAWKNSTKGYRENMLNREFRYMGFGWSVGKSGKYYFCMVFVKEAHPNIEAR